MLTPTDLDSPAKLQYWATDLSMTSSATDWDGARGFGTLREAVQFVIEEEPEGGKQPYILAASGFILTPEMLPGLGSAQDLLPVYGNEARSKNAGFGANRECSARAAYAAELGVRGIIPRQTNQWRKLLLSDVTSLS